MVGAAPVGDEGREVAETARRSGESEESQDGRRRAWPRETLGLAPARLTRIPDRTVLPGESRGAAEARRTARPAARLRRLRVTGRETTVETPSRAPRWPEAHGGSFQEIHKASRPNSRTGQACSPRPSALSAPPLPPRESKAGRVGDPVSLSARFSPRTRARSPAHRRRSARPPCRSDGSRSSTFLRNRDRRTPSSSSRRRRG